MFVLFNAFLFACGEEGTEPTEPPGTQIGTEDAVPEEDSGALFNDDTIEDDSTTDTEIVSHTIEGKWLWSPDPDDRTYANTMYEFVDGHVYTSYAANCGWADNLCSDADFNSLDATDRIPGVHTYTFDGNTLLWDEENSMEVLFECDGGIMLNGPSGKLWRLSSDCE